MGQFEVSIAHGRRSPAEESRRGGDFFCHAAQDREMPMLLLGDVASKSLAGDFLSVALQLMFHRTLSVVRSPADLLERLNAGLLHCTGSITPSEHFSTAFAATIDQRAAMMTFAAAGTEAALLVRRDGSHEHLGATGSLLGLARNASYANCVLPFGPGDRILAYTDGVTEARSATSGAFFGTSGIARCLRRTQRSGQNVCTALLAELDAFTGKRYRDDVTVAAVEVVQDRSIGPAFTLTLLPGSVNLGHAGDCLKRPLRSNLGK
jgi:sigma-B regulation protein RsbU (phosphoserine phosphatase)